MIFTRLDKNSEIVLRYLIENHSPFWTETVMFDVLDKIQIPKELINDVFKALDEERYIKAKFSDSGIMSASLTNKGMQYFKRKHHDNFKFWVPIIISNLIAFTALVISILAHIKQ